MSMFKIQLLSLLIFIALAIIYLPLVPSISGEIAFGLAIGCAYSTLLDMIYDS